MKTSIVYHELKKSDSRSLDEIKESGLWTRRESLNKKQHVQCNIEFDEWMDSIIEEFLPKRLRGKEITRMGSIYAWTEEPIDFSRILEIEVDSKQAHVASYNVYGSAFSSGIRDNPHAERYFKEIVTLEEYHKSLQRTIAEVMFSPKAIKSFNKILLPE